MEKIDKLLTPIHDNKEILSKLGIEGDCLNRINGMYKKNLQ